VQAVLVSLAREVLTWNAEDLEPRTVETILGLFRGGGGKWMFAHPEIGQMFSRYIKGKKPTVRHILQAEGGSGSGSGMSSMSGVDHDWVMPMEEYLRMVQDLEKGWLAAEVTSSLSSLKEGGGKAAAGKGREREKKTGKKVVEQLATAVVQE